MLMKKYSLFSNGPSAVSEDQYFDYCCMEYSKMLENQYLLERNYQSFFEHNPCMLPGALEGNPSHGPLFWAVISQPEIGRDIVRRPDFMWITMTSLELIPVLIEIERPNKTEFRVSDNVQNSKFTQALEQIKEWKALLKKHDVLKAIFERYSIPDRLARPECVKPVFKLIYGRRKEFENDPWLQDKRRAAQENNFDIISFDRLSPNRGSMSYGCIRIDGKGCQYAVSVPPTFRLGPVVAEVCSKWSGFPNAVRESGCDDDRKQFLISRYEYWSKWALDANHGLYCTSDWE